MRRPNPSWLALAACALVVVAQAASAGPLRTAATAKGLFVGAAVNMTPFRGEPIYSETLRREYNLLVAENTTTSVAVTYQFSLAAGQTLGPSTSLVFAAQTSGSGSVHPTAGDTYTVTYTTGGQSFTRSGSF